MGDINGQQVDLQPPTDEELEQAENELRDEVRIDARMPAVNITEAVAPTGFSAFEQAEHSRMIESVDRTAQEWVHHLKEVRTNNMILEQHVLERAAALKSEITRLHLLGVQVMREAERGHQINDKLAEGLETS